MTAQTAETVTLPRQPDAGEVVMGYLNAQVSRLMSLDLAVRNDRPDAVHQMRVTVRRLRAALQSYPKIVDGEQTTRLQAELKWLGGVLGAARDAEVLDGHLHASLAAVPAELVIGPAQARLTAHFAQPGARSRAALLKALDSRRYRTLRASLARLLDKPPLTAAAAEPARAVLPKAVRHASRRVSRRMRDARHTAPGQDRDLALHEARKAAKRARYAADAAAPGLGEKQRHQVERLAGQMKKVQSTLGDHQDAVLARQTAREIGVQAHLAGENAFSFGLLHERAHHQALAAERDARHVWRHARHSAGRHWLPKS